MLCSVHARASTCGNPSCGCWGGSCGDKIGSDFVPKVKEYLARKGLTEEDLRQAIEGIDLTMVKMKIMDSREGKGWSKQKADGVEVAYKRYLFLFATREDIRVVPTLDIDALWHQHILDTRAYFSDCDTVFGTYMHHFPYFGMRGEADAADLNRSFRSTCALYKEVFGEDYVPA
jgi:hypothetical protein